MVVFKRIFVWVWLILLPIGVATQAKAQEVAPIPQLYTEEKGLSLYLLLQPAWQAVSVFDMQLLKAGFPPTNKFAVAYGLGGYYQFKTGTAVGLEGNSLSSVTELNNSFTRVEPLLYMFNVKQFFLYSDDVRFFVNASYLAVEQQFTLTPNTAPAASFVQAFNTTNAISLQREMGLAGVGLGWTFEGGTGPEHEFTNRVEVELGYRFTVESPFYTVQGTTFDGLPGDGFRQFYITMRVGLFAKGKAK